MIILHRTGRQLNIIKSQLFRPRNKYNDTLFTFFKQCHLHISHAYPTIYKPKVKGTAHSVCLPCIATEKSQWRYHNSMSMLFMNLILACSAFNRVGSQDFLLRISCLNAQTNLFSYEENYEHYRRAVTK